jgi:DNA-binding response OmpR family regulator
MGLKILVVDDDEAICKFLKTFLVQKSHEVDLALDVSSAIELLNTPGNEYDLVITDKNMPDLNGETEGGMDVLRHVTRKFPETQVIMITGYATIQTATEALKLGAFDYLTKPFSNDVLQEKIDRISEYKKYMNPKSIITIYRDIHSSMLEALNNRDYMDDEKLTRLLNTLNAKIDLFFRAQKEWEKIILRQRESLSKTSAYAEQLMETVNKSDPAYDLIKKIFTESNQRI